MQFCRRNNQDPTHCISKAPLTTQCPMWGPAFTLGKQKWNVYLLLSVYFWIKGYSICPFCWRFAVLAWPVSVGWALCTCVCICILCVYAQPLCCRISAESSIYIRHHLLEVFAHRLSVTVIAVARLGNQILFIASRLFQHIRMMINREMGVV